ncbi:GTP-binding protein Di-Ras1 isoform X1 [Urocitellus parryii]
MPEQSNDYRVVVFGAGGVGKSSLVLRFVKGTFRDTYIPTIEDTYRQVISCDKSVCTLQITDTTGSHQFPAMQRLSISKGHAFILVFSVTSKQSLEELGPIYQLIVQIKGSVEDIPVMLVGNKCDETQREVDTREAQALAQQWKCAFMETSAKMNYNVKELFQELLTLETRRSMSLNIDGKRSRSPVHSRLWQADLWLQDKLDPGKPSPGQPPGAPHATTSPFPGQPGGGSQIPLRAPRGRAPSVGRAGVI